MSFLASLIDGWTGSSRRRQDLVDLLLIVGLSDGELDEEDLDIIARAVLLRRPLLGIGWQDVLDRAEVLVEDGPMFLRSVERLALDLSDLSDRRFGLSLAAQMLREPVAPETAALMSVLADAFEIPEHERAELLAPWEDLDPSASRFVRCGFNDPRRAQQGTIFDAMAHAEKDTEVALLAFKLAAMRSVVFARNGLRLAGLGELIELEQGSFRVDAFLSDGEQHRMSRFISRGEAMHRQEREILPHLIVATEPSVVLLVAHSDGLSPRDRYALDALPSHRVEIVALDPGVGYRADAPR